MSDQASMSPLEQYRQNLMTGVRSSASDYARKMQEKQYLERKMQQKFIMSATQAANELELVVQKTRTMNETLEQFQIFSAQLATEVYGLQSWLTYLSSVTGEEYHAHMDDPQSVSPISAEGLMSVLTSISASTRYIREHTASTKIIMDTNRTASAHVQRLASAMQPTPDFTTVLQLATTNRHAESVTQALARLDMTN